MSSTHSLIPIPPSLLLFLLQFLFLPHVRSQPQQQSPPPGYPYADFNPSIITIIVILVAALFLMGFFTIYIRRRSNEGGGSIRAAISIRRRATAATRGLDSSVIETFPTFVYSSVKGLKIGKGALECAVCLNEYEDEETLRLIPKCDHVFHPECIDAWLESHVTCPVCRANLVPDSGGEIGDAEIPVSDSDSVSVSVVDDSVVNVDLPPPPTTTATMQTQAADRPAMIPRLFDKFRSHSTGHSLVQPGENLDRFTLRLPADVRKQVVNRALLNRMGSTTARMVGEGSGRNGYRTAGAISGRRKHFKRLESLDRVVVRSERWVMSRAPSFLSRAMSPRVVSEASTSSAAADTIPLNNLGPKSC